MQEVYIIESENSSIHWKFFNPSGKNVLDLGCGKWSVSEHDEMSPVYFKSNGALKIIGVDADEREIEYFNKSWKQADGSVFICQSIGSADDIRTLIEKYNITAIKSDIEGAETNMYSLTKHDLRNIEELSIEYHSPNICQRIVEKCNEWNFHIHQMAKFKQNLDYGVIFSRRSK